MSCVSSSVSRLDILAGAQADHIQELNLMRMYVDVQLYVLVNTKLFRQPTRTVLSSTESKSRLNSRSRSPPTGMSGTRKENEGDMLNFCRYDLLCFEGIALMLNIFLGRVSLPEYKLTKPAKMEQIIVKEDVRSHTRAPWQRQLTSDRPPKSAPTFQVLFFEVSNSTRLVMSPSSPCRTSFTRTWPAPEP